MQVDTPVTAEASKRSEGIFFFKLKNAFFFCKKAWLPRRVLPRRCHQGSRAIALLQGCSVFLMTCDH